jgi:hypothetical protein
VQRFWLYIGRQKEKEKRSGARQREREGEAVVLNFASLALFLGKLERKFFCRRRDGGAGRIE